MSQPLDTFVDIGFQMHIRRWSPATDQPAKRPFLLVHGLSSNARTWDAVARDLAAAGHPVIAVDQRGHGRSDKLPVEAGYDFATVTADLVRLLNTLGWERPLVAGQSWGGNVVLALGANYPGRAAGLVFVDGGFLDMKRGAPDWDAAYERFKPPSLDGTLRADMVARMRQFQPDWSDEGIEATVDNFETLPDGTLRKWLTLDRHMAIVRAMWEQDVGALFPQVQDPVLICPAGDDWAGEKKQLVDTAATAIPNATVHWFPNTAHDIHVHRPADLATTILNWTRTQNLQ